MPATTRSSSIALVSFLMSGLVTTTARAEVNAHGDYTTAVPIEVPSFRGMAPTVSLAYSASAGDGIVGVGWRLDATSVIVRTGPRGGIPSAILAPGDRFELDGEELMACAPNSASPSCFTAVDSVELGQSSAGFYSTRRESFQRLQHQGGLTPWKVWLTDGRTGRYETHDGGQTWLLAHTEDRHGNGLDYTYTCGPSMDCELTSIRYGDNGGARGAEIHFYYEARPDPQSRGTGTAFVGMPHRLRSITVEVGGNLARAYALAYTTSTVSGRSILSTVQQFARDAVVDKITSPGRITAGATPPLLPTTYIPASQAGAVGWHFGSTAPGAGLFALATDTGAPAPRHYVGASVPTLAGQIWNPDLEGFMSLPYQTLVGDFDGDGRADVAIGYVKQKCSQIGVHAELTRKGGRFSVPGQITTKFPSIGTSDCTPTFWVADIDGDHRDDVIYKFRDTLFAARLGDLGFVAAPSSVGWTTRPDHCTTADVDGDERDDLMCLTDQSGSVQLVTARSRGDGTYAVTTTSPGVAIAAPMASGDINGDGFADVVFATPDGTSRKLVVERSVGDGTYVTETQPTTWAIGSDDRLAATDVDGDGLSDAVLTRNGTGGTGGIALSIEGVGAGRFEIKTLSTAWTGPLIGDVDGDGKTDLINKTDFTAAIGDGQGGFAAPVSVFATTVCKNPAIVDTDGDDRTDLLCMVDPVWPSTSITLDDFMSTRPVRDTYHWMSGDFDGDGQGDFAYVRARNPGVDVTTVLTTGTARRVPWSSPASVVGLDDSSATHWLVADVAGPGGRVDGKDDLVMVDTDGTTLRVYTLIGNGDGTFTPIVDTPWRDAAGVVQPYADSDLGNFWPLDVDGDGDADLVHLRPDAGGARVEILLARGDGLWSSSATTYFAGATPGFAAVTDFRAMEVNGDGLTDLVNVQSGVGMTGTVVRSLISRGDGTFTAAADTRSAAWLDIARWQAVDLNGDGLTDLLHVQSSTVGTASMLSFDELLSRGDGTFQTSQYASATLGTFDPELTGALEATSSIIPADLDGNGFTDLLHVSRYRDAAGARHTVLARLLNPGLGATLGTWNVPTPTKVPGTILPSGTPWAFRPHRDPARPYSASFAVFDASGPTSAVYEIPADRLARIDNGNGGITDIAYAALVGSARDYMPASYLPIVTMAVTRTDLAYSPAIAEATTYGYSGARWSDARQQMLGFAWVTARDPRLLGVTHYTTDEACPGGALMTGSIDQASWQILTYTTNGFVAPGAAAPFTCMVQQQSQYACEGTGSCRLQDDVTMTYDAYGNVAASSEKIADGPTRDTSSPVYGNEAAYVVDMPMYNAVYQDGSTLISLDAFEYDGNTSSFAATGPLGEVHRIQHWDSTTGSYVTTELTYDATGLPVRATDPEGGWTETTYDPDYHAFPISACDPIGCTTMEWDTVNGQIVASIDLNGAPTRFEFDPHGRVTQVTRSDGGFTRTRFLDLGTVTGPQAHRQRTRTELADGSPGDGVVWTEQYLDGWGRTYRVEHEGGAAQTTEYRDLSARPSRISETFTTGGTPSRFTAYTYDAIGRMIEQDASDGTSRRWRFGLGTIDAIDELGKVRTVGYDGLHEVIRVTETANGVPVDTRYGYDAAHRMIGSTDAAGLVTSYYYDTLGRLVGERDPDRGLREYTYRADGKLRTQIDAKGQVIEYTYDGTGRPVQREDRDDSGNTQRKVRWTYDEIPGMGPQGASIGKVVQIDDDQARTSLSTTLSYDVMGRVFEDRSCIDGACYQMRHEFDLAGRLSRLTYPDSRGKLGGNDETVEHSYDDAGRLAQVGRYVTQVDYTVDGLPTHLMYGNGIATDTTYDPDRRWTTTLTIGKIYDAGYTHDGAGRITNVSENAPTNIDQMEYGYDDLGRLRYASTTNPQLDRSFVYDAIGRITYSSKLGDYHYLDPDHPHAMTSADFGSTRAYDASGNAIAVIDPGGRSLKIAWTVDDRPASIDANGVGYELAYDAGGRRVKKDSASDRAIYVNDYLAVENGRYIKYYFAGARLVARDDNGTVAYYHQDLSHSTRVETDDAGNILNSYQYDITGVPVKENESFDDNIGFGGVHGDQALGIVYMGARYYDPVSARFLSADSVVRDQFMPQSHDRYAYVENDPVNHWDPSGHMRRLVEAMQERKQHMRNLWVAMAQTDICGPAGQYCSNTPPVYKTVNSYTGSGSIYGTERPDKDPGLPSMEEEEGGGGDGGDGDGGGDGSGDEPIIGAGDPLDFSGGGKAERAGGAASNVGAAQAAAGATNPDANSGPVLTDITAPVGGTSKPTTVMIGKTAVTALVVVGNDGRVTKVGVTINSRDQIVVTNAEVVGDQLVVQLTKKSGTSEIVVATKSDNSSSNGSQDMVRGSAALDHVGGSEESSVGRVFSETVKVDVNGDVGLKGSHSGNRLDKAGFENSGKKTTRQDLEESQSVYFHLIITGTPAPPRPYMRDVPQMRGRGVIMEWH